ncbi:MAG: glycogen synthase GlgA [Pseudomonadota bacterium]|nr:MAG: glycogen synthase GlgA [Pseudomonadota bacterium]
MPRVLFVTSECYPLIKTGGLGDVCGSLPPALSALGVDVRVLMPAYRAALAHAGRLQRVAEITIPEMGVTAGVLEGQLPDTHVGLWLLDWPAAYDRSGNPYLDSSGTPWSDNAQRFALLARAAVQIANGRVGLAWQPEIVHAHDWQTGLVPALLAPQPVRPATVFTIHNLAYQGLFPYETFRSLNLPDSLWSIGGVEFYSLLSFMKGGLTFADRITTVSPNYAHEIQTPAFGCGLDGLLGARADVLRGILNGIDHETWNPATDPHLVQPFTFEHVEDKKANKHSLQIQLGLPAASTLPLIGWVGRLVEQKGIDLLLDALPELLRLPLQLAVLGSGEARFEQALRTAALQAPDRIAAVIGYDEALAHRIEAGADIFLMPSRFEPCGLNQLYSLRYGTVPIVHRVGGLADTVIDGNSENLRNQRANGVVFDAPEADALCAAVKRALALYREPTVWRSLQRAGMEHDYSWRHSAAAYRDLYRELVDGRMARPA